MKKRFTRSQSASPRSSGRDAGKARTCGQKRNLDEIRKEIDRIDREIVTLLDCRASLAISTAEHKEKRGEQIYQPSREARVVEKALKRRKVFPPEALVAVYREIIGASLALERPFSIGILGPEATYTHAAAIAHFGHQSRVIFESSIADVFLRVEKREVDVGIVPIENSTEGVVVHTLDNLVESTLSIAGEILLPVHHHLLVHPDTYERIKKENIPGNKVIRRILSHPQGLAQCRAFLEARYPGVAVANVSSTAAAAQYVMHHPASAAVASQLAARCYGLKVLNWNIEDVVGNTTRFLVLRMAKRQGDVVAKTGKDKTSIAFSMKDRPGALSRMLEPFTRRNVNLTKIESRPSRVRTWRYTFFVDMDGHVHDKKIRDALAELENECQFYKLLGSYPRSFTDWAE